MQFVLIGLGLLVGLAGLVLLSQATVGVGLIGFACLLGITARIVQAHAPRPEMAPQWTPPTPEQAAQIQRMSKVQRLALITIGGVFLVLAVVSALVR